MLPPPDPCLHTPVRPSHQTHSGALLPLACPLYSADPAVKAQIAAAGGKVAAGNNQLPIDKIKECQRVLECELPGTCERDPERAS